MWVTMMFYVITSKIEFVHYTNSSVKRIEACMRSNNPWYSCAYGTYGYLSLEAKTLSTYNWTKRPSNVTAVYEVFWCNKWRTIRLLSLLKKMFNDLWPVDKICSIRWTTLEWNFALLVPNKNFLWSVLYIKVFIDW